MPYTIGRLLPKGCAMKKECTVVGKYKETEEITSFYLKAADGTCLLESFKPGQFVTVQPEGLDVFRAYSVSTWAPNEAIFRISVRRVSGRNGHADGVVSTFLHDKVNIGDTVVVGAPAGSFVLEKGDTPVCLIGAGVGITPVLTMLGAVAVGHPSRPVHFIYVCRTEKDFPMKEEADLLMSKLSEGRMSCFYTREEIDSPEGKYLAGRPSALRYKELGLDLNADYFICGSVPFMESQKEILLGLGVPQSQIHDEVIPTA